MDHYRTFLKIRKKKLYQFTNTLLSIDITKHNFINIYQYLTQYEADIFILMYHRIDMIFNFQSFSKNRLPSFIQDESF